MPRKVIPKQRPPGLGPEPRAGQEKADQAALLKAVERELAARGHKYLEPTRHPTGPSKPIIRASLRASAAVKGGDPVTAKWFWAIQAAAHGHPELLIELSGDPDIVACIKVQRPKQKPGRPQSLPWWAVPLAKEVRVILRQWFTLSELKSWPSAADIAAVIVANDVEPYWPPQPTVTLDDDLGDWPKQITGRLK